MATPIPNPAVVFQTGRDRWAALVNLDTAASLALNPTGVVVWKLVDGKRDAAAIIAAVRNRFQGVPDSVADDVLALLETLAKDGFVGYEWDSSGPPPGERREGQ